ncbi:hypothetical protein CYLTODRAFT_16755 [Cylindrobasidium torrendii FP15055 ss-10]|uniref:DH domain-containing protein n=1 Tax=Cylindrobasidium torrendii FP15055 ss-10 TaxID=1314674 RepID=A0A0D7B958_9AGAR|nr:hypothetical protein CYLTODRAFT_16755 [Cylindrobasidium torrendii FP15055 ss-10]
MYAETCAQICAESTYAQAPLTFPTPGASITCINKQYGFTLCSKSSQAQRINDRCGKRAAQSACQADIPQNIDTHIPMPAGRSRSRTDPGSLPSSKSPAIQAAFPSTPQPPRTRPFASSIPRRRFGDSTDSSDPESQFEAAARRRLIVANAEIFASSSSSSSESDLDGRLPTPSGTPLLGRFRGLGIGMTESIKERPPSAASCLSSESEYDDDDEEEEERTGDSVDLSGDEAHRRRKMALLDIVGGLQLDLGARESEYESEYNGVQGVAVGGSDESEYESDGQHSRPSPPSVYVSDGSDYTQLASPGPRTPRAQQYEAIELAQTSHLSAVQQRQAFGIPPSESDQVGTQDILSHADSVLSEMGEMGKEIWRDELEPEEFSEGAEKLFRSLSGSGTRDSFPRRRPPPLDKSYSSGPVLTPTREDVFAAFQESEAAFVARLTQTVRMFVLPLRVQDTKLWIEGVPLVIGRVLDWLEDILNLHALVLDELRQADVDAEVLRAMGFPRRMEVYAPYLVRLAEGVECLRQNVDDPQNDYGEFVRMQEAQLRDENRGEGWTLERLLVEPVNRLALYPRIFKQLLDATPKTHVDYLATLCLLRSVEWIIAAMTEVKVREDEYEHIKGLVANIRGLPGDVAMRDRKLLHQGRVYLASAPELSTQSFAFDMEQTTNTKARDRSSRLVTAIRDWDVRRASMRTGSTTTAESVSSWEAPPTPTPTQKKTLVDVFVFEDLLFFGKPTMQGTWTFCQALGLTRVLEWECEGQDIKLELLPVLDLRGYSLGSIPRDVGLQVLDLGMAEDDAGEWKESLEAAKKKTEVFVARPAGMDYDEKRLQRQYVGELLGAGLPVPKSPSMQMEMDLRSETEREEREERGWWSLRLREVMRDMSARG